MSSMPDSFGISNQLKNHKMKTQKQHTGYKKYALSIIAKCNTLTRNNLIINLEVVDIRHGRAWRKDGELYITVPVFAIARGFEYFTHYVIHEYTHHYVGFNHGHDDTFKRF